MKFDMYCDWSPYGIGVVVVEEDKGVYYNHYKTTESMPQRGEMQDINRCLDLVEELGLQNVTIHTDHLALVNSIKRGTPPMSKKMVSAKRKKHQAMYTNTMQRVSDLGVTVVYCRAHNNNPLSNAADMLTREESKHVGWEKRLGSCVDFHNKAVEHTKALPTFWDVAQAWFINLTYGAVAC
jgi:ribonuclease HI